MEETPITPARHPTKACRVCAEDIKPAARKCVHCDSYQDWRSGLGFSSTILSLLIALISVATALLPVIKTTFFEVRNSRITISPQRFSENTLSAFISNVGNRPGVVGSAGIVEVTPKDGAPRGYHFDALGSSDPVLVPAGSSILMNFMWTSSQRPQISPENLTCHLIMSATAFDGSDSYPRIPFSCAKLPLGENARTPPS